MPKIENWSRKKSEEQGNVMYVWKNDRTDDKLQVEGDGTGHYNIFVIDGRHRNPVGEKHSSVDDAYDQAVEWMKDTPYPTCPMCEYSLNNLPAHLMLKHNVPKERAMKMGGMK